MRLVSQRAQRVRLGALDLEVGFAAGEEMRTEISAKFRRERRAGRAGRAPAFASTAGSPTPPDDFALSLSFID